MGWSVHTRSFGGQLRSWTEKLDSLTAPRIKKSCAESIERAARALEGVDDVEGGDSLAAKRWTTIGMRSKMKRSRRTA